MSKAKGIHINYILWNFNLVKTEDGRLRENKAWTYVWKFTNNTLMGLSLKADVL